MTAANRDPSISALPLGDEKDLAPSSRTLFAKCREKLGFVPNVLRALSFRPHQLEGFTALHDSLMLADSPLSKLEREMIAVVVSSANHCHYCLTVHGAAVRRLSGDPALASQIAFNYRSAHLTPRVRAMLDYAWAITKAPHAAQERDREALRAEGLSDVEIFDLAQVAAFFNYTNRVATGVGIEPNDDYLAAFSAPAEKKKESVA